MSQYQIVTVNILISVGSSWKYNKRRDMLVSICKGYVSRSQHFAKVIKN